MHKPSNPHILWDSPSWQLMRLPFPTRPLLNLNISTLFLAKHTKIKLIMGKNRVSKPMERRILIPTNESFQVVFESCGSKFIELTIQIFERVLRSRRLS